MTLDPISEIDLDTIIWTKPNTQHLDFLNPRAAEF